MKYCSNCGVKVSGDFCSECSALLKSPENLGMTRSQHSNWEEITSYEELLRFQSVRDLISHYATLSKKSVSGEAFLQSCDLAFVPLTGASLLIIGSIMQPIYTKLGIKTGKTKSASFNKPVGKILAALLCSLARNGRKVSRVHQGKDGCVVEAIIPSDLWSWEGILVVSVQSKGNDTYVEAATMIKGQLYDWGKSNRCLEELFTDLSMTLEFWLPKKNQPVCQSIVSHLDSSQFEPQDISPSHSSSTIRRERMLDVLRGYEDSDFSVYPNIPPKRLKGAAATIAKRFDEILGVIDVTASGNGKLGIYFMERALASKDVAVPAEFIEYRKLINVVPQKHIFSVQYGTFNMYTCWPLGGYSKDKLIECLQHILEI